MRTPPDPTAVRRAATRESAVVRMIFRPPVRMTGSQWADAFRFLSPESSAIPGRYDTARAPYQREPLDAMCDPLGGRVVLKWPSQVGKALALDTPIATPDGWTTMGGIRVGDRVFSETGDPCRVTHTSPVFEGRPCFRVTFSDGAEVIADGSHRWAVYPQGSEGGARILTTDEIRASLKCKAGRAFRHRVAVAGPLELPDADLPIPPYTLGAWLGDGNSAAAILTFHHEDAATIEAIRAEGVPVHLHARIGNSLQALLERRATDACRRGHSFAQYRIPGTAHCRECNRLRYHERRHGTPMPEKQATMYGRLVALGVLNNKHVPPRYLRASRVQRLALLQGLLDTDGYCSWNGLVEYTTTSERLAKDVVALTRTLGLKPRMAVGRATLHGRDVGPKYRVTFTAYAELPVFRLDRKRVRQRSVSRPGARPTESTRRSIVAVEPVPSVPVRCIAVDSPSHLFLAGEALIPTHNTEVVNNAIGYRMHLRPGPILVLQPTLDMGEAWSKDRLAPMVRDTPALRRLVKDPRSRDSGNTLLHKNFPGGHLTVAGANSPAGLASRPIRDVFCDETDRYPSSAGSEGDPISLAFRRTATFGNALHVLISTPTLKGQSRIEKAFEESDQRHYYVPCPHCGEFQILRWGGRDVAHGLKWEPGKPETAYYVCEPNGCEIEEVFKPQMLARGEWRAHNPGHPTKGYWLNGLYSPFDGARWGKLVAEFLEVKSDPLRLRAFANTVWCEEWEDAGEQVEAHKLADRFETYPCSCAHHEAALCTSRKVPAGVGVLVRTVDTQGDRLETAVWGFGAGEEAWPIETEILPGDPGIPEGSPGSPWNALAKRLTLEYEHVSGVMLRPMVTGIDAGGHHAKNVYAFTRPRQAQRVYALHGSTHGEGAPLLSRPARNNSAKAILYAVGVFTAKEAIMARLAKITEAGPGYVHIPDWMDGEHLEQLTAEKLVTKIVGGRPKRIWLKTRARNEFLDLFAYALAMLHVLGPATVKGLGTLAQKHVDEGAALRQDAAPAEEGAEQQPGRRTGWGQRRGFR